MLSRSRPEIRKSRRRLLEAMLDQRRRGLLEAVRVMRGASGGYGHEPITDEDRRPGEVAQYVTSTLAELESNTLRCIEDAIRRLQEGRYGFCADCRQAIPSDRLAAVPFAVLCLPCQDRREASGEEVVP